MLFIQNEICISQFSSYQYTSLQNLCQLFRYNRTNKSKLNYLKCSYSYNMTQFFSFQFHLNNLQNLKIIKVIIKLKIAERLCVRKLNRKCGLFIYGCSISKYRHRALSLHLQTYNILLSVANATSELIIFSILF